MPYIESIRTIRTTRPDDYVQHIARVVVERHETVSHDDKFPHFEGRQYRSLGTMTLIDGEDWKPNQRGVDVRSVEVGVLPVEPDGTSIIRFRFPKRLLVGRDIDPSRLSELDAAGKERFGERLAHLDDRGLRAPARPPIGWQDAWPVKKRNAAKKKKRKR